MSEQQAGGARDAEADLASIEADKDVDLPELGEYITELLSIGSHWIKRATDAEAERQRLAAELAAVWAERDELRELPEWIVRKLQTMEEYYEPPSDGRDIKREIQGWMHVLCFHYEQNRREVKEYDSARRAAKQLRAHRDEIEQTRNRLAGELEQARQDLAALRQRVEELERERDELRDGLAWYGEQSRLARLIHSEGDAGRNAIANDGGRRAARLLAGREAAEPSTQGDTHADTD